MFFLFLAIFFSLPSYANIAGTDLQNFNPTVSSQDFVSVYSDKTIPESTVSISFFTNYAYNSLPFFNASGLTTSQKLVEPNDELISMDFGFGFGITENWDLRLSLPLVAYQNIDESVGLGFYDRKSVTELRIASKYSFAPVFDIGLALLGGLNIHRIENDPFSGSDPSPSFSLTAIATKPINDLINIAFNLGYRFRNGGEPLPISGVSPISDQITYSAALSYQLADRTQAVGELYGATPTDETQMPTDREDSNLEILLGLKHFYQNNLVLHAGLGREIYHGLATPDFRAYAGLQWNFGLQETAPIEIAPEPIRTSQPAPKKQMTITNLSYTTGSTRPVSSLQITRICQQINTDPDQDIQKIVVEGHTDNVGSVLSNDLLSQKRANHIAEYFRNCLSTKVQQIVPIGYGEKRPIGDNRTAFGREQNRRVEIKIF